MAIFKRGAKTSDEHSDSSPDRLDVNKDGSPVERSDSIADVFHMEGLTLYEKKCMLVNREIDSMGMGRYQWCLWGLCGT